MIISVSGLRGVVGEEVTADLARRWGAAFGSLQDGGKVVVGRDARPSGAELSRALINGILSQGADVVDAGLCSTPTLELAVRHLGASGGVMVTASHNPPEYNGLKFFGSDGVVVAAEIGLQLETIAESGLAGAADNGTLTEDDALVAVHVDAVIDGIDADAVRSCGFKVAVDGCSSVGGPMLTSLLEKLGCEVAAIDCEPTGIFTRTAEPRAEFLGVLSETVRKAGSDVGFAVDPDGDRLCVATADGTVLSEEYTVPLVSMYILEGTDGEKVVVNLSTSRMIEDVAARFGAAVLRAPVGERNVVAAMLEAGSVVGGEGNGGPMVPAINPSRDAAVGAACVLALLASKNMSLADIASDIPSYEMIKEKFSVTRGDFSACVGDLEKALEGAVFDRADGLRAAWPDRWVHIRPSGTEPIVRVYAEASDMNTAAGLVETVGKVLA